MSLLLSFVIMFNDKIPWLCTVALRLDMDDSWVFPLLIEDNTVCALSTSLSYTHHIPLQPSCPAVFSHLW